MDDVHCMIGIEQSQRDVEIWLLIAVLPQCGDRYSLPLQVSRLLINVITES